ncbi:unnamed protein product [Pleuronectes platessa]|uniref:Uncharacterized protein n=1 Tax=Pleuronectes platessa TaxID=8262 RepID=A0A9N7UZU2_PLEPL|nr:unnamed protein product [Pleuronectes platessa]
MELKSEPTDRSIENKSEALKEEGSPSVLAEDPNSAGNHVVKMESKSEPKDRSIENKSEGLKEEGSPSGKPPPVKKDCNVLAMHSGGYKFIDESVIEFGYSLFDILERIKIQLVEKEEADQTYKEFFKFFDKKEEPVPKDT